MRHVQELPDPSRRYRRAEQVALHFADRPIGADQRELSVLRPEGDRVPSRRPRDEPTRMRPDVAEGDDDVRGRPIRFRDVDRSLLVARRISSRSAFLLNVGETGPIGRIHRPTVATATFPGCADGVVETAVGDSPRRSRRNRHGVDAIVGGVLPASRADDRSHVRGPVAAADLRGHLLIRKGRVATRGDVERSDRRARVGVVRADEELTAIG